MRSVVATQSHEVPELPPLRLAVGDTVEVGERDTQWPAFVFVTCDAGSGWVPSRYLSAASGSAVVRVPYDTTELPTTVHEVLDVLTDDLESGWLWCRSAGGREGWVPVRTVEPASGVH